MKKTVEELRKMMKDKRYSGDISERDAEFIREVENGFKALYPLREYHLDKVPEEIKGEYEARAEQLKTCRRALDETKAQISSLELSVDKVEQAGNLKKIRNHMLLLEETKLYSEILEGRLSVVSRLSAEANKRFREALEMTHDCHGCRWLLQQHQQTLCNYGYDQRKPARPTSEIEQCPDSSGQMLDRDRPIIRREAKELPRQGLG
jgi:hypothetical protein